MYKFFPISIIFTYIFFVSVSNALAAPIVAGSFSTTWDGGDSSVIQIGLGACPTAVYWEEIGNEANNGTTTVCSGDGNNQIITFPYASQYRVDFSGNFTEIDLGDQNNRDKFRSVEQWGDSVWTSLEGAFQSVTNLSITASDAPDLSAVTSLESMFRAATNFNSNINHWDVSTITNMRYLFGFHGEPSAFNQPLDSWNVSNVEIMHGVFMETPFNQPLDNWDLSSALTIDGMFLGATDFNQPINSWNVANVTTMNGLFEGATSFNQPLDAWDVSNVTNMPQLFYNATAFNQPLDSWDVSSVTNMSRMFEGAVSFNQPINSWNVANVNYMDSMFFEASSFNQDLSAWNVFNVTQAQSMFTGTALSTANYSNILESWSNLTLQNDVDLSYVGGIYDEDSDEYINLTTYCSRTQPARDILTNLYNWSVTDGGPEVCPVAPVESNSGSEGTKIGIRSERLQTLRDTLQSTTTPVTASINSFVATVKNLITYLTENEEEIANLTPEESKQLIVTLRDALLWLLRWIPGV